MSNAIFPAASSKFQTVAEINIVSNDAYWSYEDFEAGYNYTLEADNLISLVNSQVITTVLGIAGPTWRTSLYRALDTRITQAAALAAYMSTTQMNLLAGVGVDNVANEGIFKSSITLFDPANAATKTVWESKSCLFDGTTMTINNSDGQHNTAEAHTGLKMSIVGNWASGRILVSRQNRAV